MRLVAPLLALLLMISPVAAEPLGRRPLLGVAFELVDPTYRQGFSEADIRRLERHCARQMAAALSAQLPFADFQPAEGQANRLRIRLGSPSAGGLEPVFFHLGLEGTAVARGGGAVAWLFRDLEASVDPLGDWGQFAAEVTTTFAGHLERQRDLLVNNLLSGLKLADQAYLLPDEDAWVLPFSREELRADDDSEFRIRTLIQLHQSLERPVFEVRSVGEILPGNAAVPAPFRSKIKARPKRHDPELIQRLRSADRVRILYVLLTRYVRLEGPAATPIPPSALGQGTGGGP